MYCNLNVFVDTSPSILRLNGAKQPNCSKEPCENGSTVKTAVLKRLDVRKAVLKRLDVRKAVLKRLER
jgi:hypothetical protein